MLICMLPAALTRLASRAGVGVISMVLMAVVLTSLLPTVGSTCNAACLAAIGASARHATDSLLPSSRIRLTAW